MMLCNSTFTSFRTRHFHVRSVIIRILSILVKNSDRRRTRVTTYDVKSQLGVCLCQYENALTFLAGVAVNFFTFVRVQLRKFNFLVNWPILDYAPFPPFYIVFLSQLLISEDFPGIVQLHEKRPITRRALVRMMLKSQPLETLFQLLLGWRWITLKNQI